MVGKVAARHTVVQAYKTMNQQYIGRKQLLFLW